MNKNVLHSYDFGGYKIVARKCQKSRSHKRPKHLMFDVDVIPTQGHRLSLENVHYSPRGIFDGKNMLIPSGKGFKVNVSNNLKKRLTKIAKELYEIYYPEAKTKETISKKKTKTTVKKEQKVEQVFSSSFVNKVESFT